MGDTNPISITFTMTGLKEGNEAYIEFDDSGFSWDMESKGITVSPVEGSDAISVTRIIATSSKLSVTLGGDGDALLKLAFDPASGADNFTGTFHGTSGTKLTVMAIVDDDVQVKTADPNGKFTITY